MKHALLSHMAHRPRLPVWVAPIADERRGQELRQRWHGHVVPVASGARFEGPAVMLLAGEELVGPEREHLLSLARRAQPGRPVIVGHLDNKDILLDAINTWRVFRMIPPSAGPEVLIEAVRGAHDALSLERAVERCVEQLKEDCLRLEGTLAELKSTQDRLLHAERLATVGGIVGALMRHARTPLAKLERFRTLENMVGDDARLSEYVDCISEGIDGFGTLLQDLLALTEKRQPDVTLRKEPLDAVVERSTRLFRYDPLGRDRSVEGDFRSASQVQIDRNRMHQVLLNLMRNAAQATKDGDRIVVRTLRHDDICLIEVEDFGSGMSEAVMNRIFSPFFTTKGDAGMGLGLRMSRASIEQQGGTLECTSQQGRGSRFRIRLPSAG